MSKQKQKTICVHNMFWGWNFHVLNSYFFVLRILVDLFRYKSLECITDSTFQCKGYEEQRVIRLHISFEHFEPKSPGKKIFTGPLETGGRGKFLPSPPLDSPDFQTFPWTRFSVPSINNVGIFSGFLTPPSLMFFSTIRRQFWSIINFDQLLQDYWPLPIADVVYGRPLFLW